MRHSYSFLTVILLLCCCPALGQNPQDELFPPMKGWTVGHPYPVYLPGNLWDYINGAADAFLSYDFVDLNIAEYIKGKKKIKVEIYRHKSPVHAFGMYSMERSEDLNFVNIGAQGYHQDDVLNFFCFNFYVKMFANSTDRKTYAGMEKLAANISKRLGSHPAFPPPLTYFPGEGKLANTESYVARNFLGHAFFNDVYTARYDFGSGRFQLFITPRASADECRRLLTSYLEFTGQDASSLTEGKITIHDPYNGDIHLVWERNNIWGVTESAADDDVERILDAVRPLLAR